jgi:hypothetical protein
MNSLDALGQGFFDLAANTENAWGKMGKNMILTFLDVVKQILTAQMLLSIARQDWAGAALAGAGIVGLSALQASANNISFGGEDKEAGTYSSSSSGSNTSNNSSNTNSTSSTSPVSNVGGGNLVINLYNPVFMDKATKERTIDDLLLIAQNYGWNVTKSLSVAVG